MIEEKLWTITPIGHDWIERYPESSRGQSNLEKIYLHALNMGPLKTSDLIKTTSSREQMEHQYMVLEALEDEGHIVSGPSTKEFSSVAPFSREYTSEDTVKGGYLSAARDRHRSEDIGPDTSGSLSSKYPIVFEN